MLGAASLLRHFSQSTPLALSFWQHFMSTSVRRQVWLQPVLGVGKGVIDLALRWPSRVITPHHEHGQTALAHTPHTPHQTKGMAPGALSNSVDSRLCGVRGVRGVCVKATQPRPRRDAGTPPGTCDL